MTERVPYNANATVARVLCALSWHLAAHGKAVVTINGVTVLDLTVEGEDLGLTAAERAAILAAFTPEGDHADGGNA